MSEPASLYVTCPIPREGLTEALIRPAPEMAGAQDWDGIGWDLSPADREVMARLTGRTLGDFMRETRKAAEVPADWMFRYDDRNARLEIGQVLCTDAPRSILIIFSYLRRLGFFVTGPGFAILQDTVFGNRSPLAGLRLDRGIAAPLPGPDVPREWAAAVAPALLQVREAIIAGAAGPVRDDLDLLTAGR